MQIINSLIDFFGLAPDIATFTDLLVWLCKMFLAVQIVTVSIKAMFTASWKLERMLK